MSAMLRLATPFVIVQVGLMLMGVVDTMVVGRVSAQALASVALGNLMVFAVSAFGMGLLMALDPLVAQAVGADDRPAIRRSVQRGLILAAALTLPSGLILSLGEAYCPCSASSRRWFRSPQAMPASASSVCCRSSLSSSFARPFRRWRWCDRSSPSSLSQTSSTWVSTGFWSSASALFPPLALSGRHGPRPPAAGCCSSASRRSPAATCGRCCGRSTATVCDWGRCGAWSCSAHRSASRSSSSSLHSGSSACSWAAWAPSRWRPTRWPSTSRP